MENFTAIKQLEPRVGRTAQWILWARTSLIANSDFLDGRRVCKNIFGKYRETTEY
jgi:hypothetical protein